jgi:hypothetical protein
MTGACAAAAAVVALALPTGPGADAPPPWQERAVAYGHLSLTFTIERLSIGARSWSAALAIRNWDITLSVHEDFALIVSGDRAGTTRRVFRATRIRPALPAVLDVRDTWRGTIAGPGRPAKGSYVRLRLGTFRAVIAPNLFIRHVTRRTYTVR